MTYIQIMNVTTGDIVKAFDNWDDTDEWLSLNQQDFMYEAFEVN